DEERRGPWKRARVPRVSPPLAGVAHRPAERIPDVFRRAVGLVSRESGRPLEHRRDVLRREERAAVRTIECDGEANEIDRRGDPTAMRVHRLEMEAAVGPGHSLAEVAREARPRHARMVIAHLVRRSTFEARPTDAHRLDPERREDVLSNVILVRLARDLLDHPAEKTVAVVRVRVALPGIEIERSAEHGTNDDIG